MEPTLGSPSMRSKYNSPPFGFYLILAILLGIALALPFHTPVGADAREQIEINDLVNDQLDIHPQQNIDSLGPHGDPQPELLMGMRELQNNLINLHPDGDIGGEHRIKELPEVLAEVRIVGNNLENRPNGDVCRNQEYSL